MESYQHVLYLEQFHVEERERERGRMREGGKKRQRGREGERILDRPYAAGERQFEKLGI